MEQPILTKEEYKENYQVVLKLISQLQDENEAILHALRELERMPTAGTPGDIAGQARAIAIRDVVRARETTNQELLKIYSRMYCDLRTVLFPAAPPERS